MKRAWTYLLVFGGSLAVGWVAASWWLIPAPRSTPSPFDGPRVPASLRGASVSWGKVASELQALPQVAERRRLLLGRIAHSRPEDIAALLLLLEDYDPDLVVTLINHWLERDPGAFAAALESFPSRSTGLSGWTHDFYSRWVSRDPEAAFARASSTTPDLLHPAIHAAVMTRFDTSPDQALAWSAQVHPDFVSSGAGGWADRHPDQVLTRVETIKALPAGIMRERLLTTAAAELAKTDVTQALEFTRNISGGFHGNARGSIARAWVKAKPDEARSFVETTADPMLRTSVATAVGESLAEAQPAEAIPWAVRWMNGRQRKSVLQKAFAALEKKDPAQAAALRETLPRPVPPPEY